jgi:uncharacterized membrane protein YfcA
MGIMSLLLPLFIGILAGLGIGSGGIYLIYLDFFTDTPQAEAQGLNLAFFVTALLSSVIYHLFHRTYRRRDLLSFLPCGIPFAAMGAYLSYLSSPNLVRTILGVLFLLAGGYTLLARTPLLPFLIKRTHRLRQKRT